MTEVLFYHLERARLEQVLPELLEKTLQRGWRAVVRTGDGTLSETICNFLWTYTDESFLPHGTDGDGADHPVFITDTEDMGGDRDLLFLVGAGEAAAGELDGLTRCIRIFDGNDEEAVLAARAFWKVAKDAGHDATYWRQSPEGRWEKKA